jgi:hypothetical protein
MHDLVGQEKVEIVKSPGKKKKKHDKEAPIKLKPADAIE